MPDGAVGEAADEIRQYRGLLGVKCEYVARVRTTHCEMRGAIRQVRDRTTLEVQPVPPAAAAAVAEDHVHPLYTSLPAEPRDYRPVLRTGAQVVDELRDRDVPVAVRLYSRVQQETPEAAVRQLQRGPVTVRLYETGRDWSGRLVYDADRDGFRVERKFTADVDLTAVDGVIDG